MLTKTLINPPTSVRSITGWSIDSGSGHVDGCRCFNDGMSDLRLGRDVDGAALLGHTMAMARILYLVPGVFTVRNVVFLNPK